MSHSVSIGRQFCIDFVSVGDVTERLLKKCKFFIENIDKKNRRITKIKRSMKTQLLLFFG